MSQSELEVRLGIRPKPVGGIKIVALMANEEDCDLLSRLAAEHQWALHFVSSCGEAWDALKESQAAIALCDRESPAMEWRDVIHMMASSAPQVYAILVSRVADDYLWNEVIRRGGHDLLTTPLREEDVLRAIRLAWSYSNSSMRVQPMLMKHHP